MITVATTDPVVPHWVYRNGQSLARNSTPPPGMPRRSEEGYSETPRTAGNTKVVADSVLSNEFTYDEKGYYRRIVHSDGRVTCPIYRLRRQRRQHPL